MRILHFVKFPSRLLFSRNRSSHMHINKTKGSSFVEAENEDRLQMLIKHPQNSYSLS